MYPGEHAVQNPERVAFIMTGSGESVSYRELEERANRVAHWLRNVGLTRLDHFSIFMENNARYIEVCSAGERSGLFYTCINSFLTAEEMGYIADNSESKVIVTSVAKLETVRAALPACPNVERVLVVGLGSEDSGDARIEDFETAVDAMSTEPLADERLGAAMLYSSGTTGRPKGIVRPLPDQAPAEVTPLFGFLDQLWKYRDDMVYLSPAPLYHSAPQAAVNLTIRRGGTVVVMERFDPIDYLQNIETYSISHSQLVPTMFSRMLKLPEQDRTRFDLSSLETVTHAAAPCPAKVKEQMIEWWGPIIDEYYGATEGLGFTACNSEEWLAHRGSVGRVMLGELHILDEEMVEQPAGTPGTIWFKTATAFEDHNDPEKTKEATSGDGTMTTVGDVGYIDEDNFLYLTDRKTFMIISGGVNIYPQETEDLLITHPLVADAAVFGVPNEDLGEEVKAVVSLMPGTEATDETAALLIAHCREDLSRQKVPRTVDFMDELPRLPTGKLYKRQLRDKYWGDGVSKIV